MVVKAAFDAFISYSHAVDGALAPALRSALQSLARPWYRRRALAVFLDQSDLSVSVDLSASIERALATSRHFIYLASREAAASPWVGKELTAWRSAHGGVGTGLFIVLTDGDLQWNDELSEFDVDRSSALHPALHGAFGREPLWVDMRWARTQGQVTLRDPRFQHAAAMLAAPLHGMELDALLGEDVRAHRRRRRVIAGTISGLVGLLLVSVLVTWLAVRTAMELQRRQEMVELVLPFTVDRHANQDPATPAQTLLDALMRAIPWRRPSETDVDWNEQPDFLPVQDDCVARPPFYDTPPETCAPPGTGYGAEGLRADMPWLPALARQLMLDIEGKHPNALRGLRRHHAIEDRGRTSSSSVDSEGQSFRNSVDEALKIVAGFAHILIPPVIADAAGGTPRAPIDPLEAYQGMSVVRYPLLSDMPAELILLNFSNNRSCGSGVCISPTLAYLRRGEDLQMVWLDTAGRRLTLLDRGAGQMPDIIATEVRQSGICCQRRLIARYQFVAGGENQWYQAHMDGVVSATMPEYSTPIPRVEAAPDP